MSSASACGRGVCFVHWFSGLWDAVNEYTGFLVVNGFSGFAVSVGDEGQELRLRSWASVHFRPRSDALEDAFDLLLARCFNYLIQMRLTCPIFSVQALN